jgi:hypothetical protein
VIHINWVQFCIESGYNSHLSYDTDNHDRNTIFLPTNPQDQKTLVGANNQICLQPHETNGLLVCLKNQEEN